MLFLLILQISETANHNSKKNIEIYLVKKCHNLMRYIISRTSGSIAAILPEHDSGSIAAILLQYCQKFWQYCQKGLFLAILRGTNLHTKSSIAAILPELVPAVLQQYIARNPVFW